jgi:hypothetical protein
VEKLMSVMPVMMEGEGRQEIKELRLRRIGLNSVIVHYYSPHDLQFNFT